MAKRMRVKYDPNQEPLPPVRQYNYFGEHGHSTQDVDCPICGEKRIPTYVWSFCGGGKRCPRCGSLLTARGAMRNTEWDGKTRYDGEKS